jgi:hypothetical protein
MAAIVAMYATRVHSKQQTSGLSSGSTWDPNPGTDAPCQDVERRIHPSTGIAISSAYISNHFLYSSESEITLTFTQSLRGLRHPPSKFPQPLVRHDHIENTLSLSSHHWTHSVALPLLYSTDTHVDHRAHTLRRSLSECTPSLSTTATPPSSTTRTPWAVLSNGIPC